MKHEVSIVNFYHGLSVPIVLSLYLLCYLPCRKLHNYESFIECGSARLTHDPLVLVDKGLSVVDQPKNVEFMEIAFLK